MKHQIRQIFTLILALVTTLVAVALVLSTNNFQEQKGIDFSVSSDFCGSDGRGGDSPNCNIGDTQCINGQTWSCVAYSANCNCPQGCRGYQQFVSNSCAGNPDPTPDPTPVPNPPPTGNNPTQCSGSAPTASVCRNAAPGTYVAQADCTCRFNGGAGSNVCGCIPNNTPDPEPEEPDMSIPVTPTQPSGEVGDNSNNNNASVVRVCGRSITDRSGGVCNGVQVGKLTASNCRCNNSCYCLPTGTGGAGDACLSDDSCAGSLVCRKQNDGSGFKCVSVQQAQQDLIDDFNTITDLIDEKNETAQQNSDSQNASDPVQCGFGKCKPGYECIDKKKQICEIPETGSGEVGDSDDGVKLPPQFALPDKLEVGPKPTKEDWNSRFKPVDSESSYEDSNQAILGAYPSEDFCYLGLEDGFRYRSYVSDLVSFAEANGYDSLDWLGFFQKYQEGQFIDNFYSQVSCDGSIYPSGAPEGFDDICYWIDGVGFYSLNDRYLERSSLDGNRVLADYESDEENSAITCQTQPPEGQPFCSSYEGESIRIPYNPYNSTGDYFLLNHLRYNYIPLRYNTDGGTDPRVDEILYTLFENQYICES